MEVGAFKKSGKAENGSEIFRDEKQIGMESNEFENRRLSFSV
uniref:Uncharacterized protein n=1 Tax=Rhizophora mucronata TaxID=61149 RepID=A0A2P2KUI3_RHIMU